MSAASILLTLFDLCNMVRPMKLSDWLENTGTSINALANLADVNVATVWRYFHGRGGLMRSDVALKISEATGWKVSVLDLLYPGRDVAVIIAPKGTDNAPQ